MGDRRRDDPRPSPASAPDTLDGMNEPRSDALSQSPATPPSGLPAGRYDDVRPVGSGVGGKFVAVLLVVLVLALVVAGVVTTYRLTTTPDISGEEVAMTVVSDDRADFTFHVTRDEPETPAYCIVRAQDQSQGEVGRREVYVPPSEGATVRLEVPIATWTRAFVGDVYGCGSDVPDYLDR